MRFSSGGITSASLSTPTIKAVWKMPNRESMQIMQRETSELNSKMIIVPVVEILPRRKIAKAKISDGDANHPNDVLVHHTRSMTPFQSKD